MSAELPTDLVRQEFARRLQRAMIEKGWTQSELARRASPFAPDTRMIRDNVSKYIRGKVLPGPLHLEALCKALGKRPTDLLPARPSGGTSHELPSFDMRDLGNGTAWLRVNQAVSWETALKIATMVKTPSSGSA